MKKAIEWVDTLVTPSGVDVRPSTLLALVQAVRLEALDTVELFVRKLGTFAEGSDAQMNQHALLVQFENWRRRE